MKRNIASSALVATLALASLALLVGCGGKKSAEDPAAKSQNNPNRPGWVDKGGGFFAGEKGKAFYGVGASQVKSVSLRRNAADAQARADLSRTFQTNIKNLIKVYQAEVSAADPNRVSQENFASEATKAFTNMDLSGSVIVDRWYDEHEKVQYSLAALDLANFQEQIQKMKELSEAVKQTIIQNATKAFEELDKEAERQAQ